MASVTLHASGQETTSGTGGAISLPMNQLVGMFTNITAVSGTLPTLIVKLQETPNGTDWYDVPNATTGTLGGIALTNTTPNAPTLVADSVRCVWTIGGVGAHFTFDVELVVV